MEDERQVELDCISAIFPEIILDADNPFSASIELPVNPRNLVKVLFPASADGLVVTPPSSQSSGEDGAAAANLTENVESHKLAYLPSLRLHITLPEGYPADCAPKFELSTTPQWLSRSQLDELQANGETLWEEAGRTEIVYGYIDFLQQAAENAFGHGEGKPLEIPQDFKIALLDYDIKATQAAFDKETFDCGVCLDPKKGSACHKMVNCGHVFCVQCLQDFYNNAIEEGDLVSVRCLDPGCAKKLASQSTKKRRKPKTLSPSELLQIPLEHEMVTRYVRLKHKADLESDKNTIYCPRQWCQGAARSKKHRKPEGLEIVESDDESDAEDGKKKFTAGEDLLSVCEDCSFAFCSRCYSSWHGEFKSCTAKRDNRELTTEEVASLEYLKLHTTPCPTCAAPAQKTHGCNHMICFKCNSHFCYLCSSWLSPENPYQHYNDIKTGCHMRLWELEGGDGDDVGIGFAGGDRVADIPDDHDEEDDGYGPHLDMPVVPADRFVAPAEPLQAAAVAVPAQQLQREDPLVLQINQFHPPPAPVAVDLPQPVQQLQREGPLVLRINHVPPPPAPAVPVPPHQAQPAPRNPQRAGAQRIIDPRPAGIRAAAPLGGRRVRLNEAARAINDDLNEAQELAHQVWAPQPAGAPPARPHQPAVNENLDAVARRVWAPRAAPRPDQAALNDEMARAREQAHQAWIQRFVQMALNDEEDQLDSDDEEEDDVAWEIPVR